MSSGLTESNHNQNEVILLDESRSIHSISDGSGEGQAQQKVTIEKMLAMKLQQATAAIVRASNALPKIGDGYELYASYPDFAKFMEQQKLRIILAMRKLLSNVGCRAKISAFGLEDMEKIISADDLLVDRIGISLDEHQMLLTHELIVKSKLSTGAEAMAGTSIQISSAGSKSLGVKDGGRYAQMFGKNISGNVESVRFLSNDVFSWDSNSVIVKPQKAFQDAIVNADLPFVPKLVVKHNSLEILTRANFRIIDEDLSSDSTNNKIKNSSGEVLVNEKNWLNEENFGEHPYQHELDQFVIKEEQLMPPENIYEPNEPDDASLVIIDTEEGLRKLILQLNASKEFAVDLEHHTHRSFLGLTCLIQISTRITDYLIDPFPIWKSMHLLNEPFSNPEIVKVFHGGDQDIIWLQRDFGIYVINLFDTGIAMRMLGFQRLGLKHLLRDFCGVDLNKELQKGDWRIRPLPQPFIEYARLDSHFLLYCYDKFRQKLTKKDSSLVKDVFILSKKISCKLFEQPRFDPEGYHELLPPNRSYNNRQLFALKQLWKWRDSTAREQDESLHYVLPNHMMLQIAETLPREMNGIIACCAPVPPLLKHDIATLFRFIVAARDLPLKKLEIASSLRSNSQAICEELDNDPLLEQNRITTLKAKLEYRIDCTNYKADEEIPSAISRLNLLKGSIKFAEEKDESDAPFMLVVGGSNGKTMVGRIRQTGCNVGTDDEVGMHIYVTDEPTEEVQKKNDAKLKHVFEKLARWVPPYDCYLTAKRQLHETEGELANAPAKKKTKNGSATIKHEVTEI